jgi:hypothetical protein
LIEPIAHITAIQILEETGTTGSSPLKVMCADGEVYYAKTTTQQQPRVELINEIICNYFLQCWDVVVPQIVLINLPQDIVEAYVQEKGKLSDRYTANAFHDVFVGFKEIPQAFELDNYINNLKNRHEWNKFRNPVDLIKIGVFDAWVCNKDRRPSNPNILIGEANNKFEFYAIDHAASFGYQTNYNRLTEILMHREDKYFILKIPLVPSIAKFVPKLDLQNLKNQLLLHMEKCCDNMDDIFNQVPAQWGFSAKGKTGVKAILSNKTRNKTTSELYIPYITKP